jgi:plastocyanin
MKSLSVSIVSLSLVLSLATPALATAPRSTFASGDLIKGSLSTVYYYASNGKRYVFPNEKTYFTWYRDFSGVRTIPDSHLAAIPLGGNVTYRPGRKMLKITTDPKVYVVDQGGFLRYVTSESLAKTLYSISWKNQIDDLPDAFFTNYRTGTPIQTAPDFNPANTMTLTTTINQDKQLDPETATLTIGNSDVGFVPSSMTIKRGTTVVWTNRDLTNHTVTGRGWDSGIIAPDGSYRRRFDTTGAFDYSCSIHPTMQGTINVIP